MPDRFIWQVTIRTTGTELTEDVNGLGSFDDLNRWNVAKVTLLEWSAEAGGYHRFHHEVPVGAEAVFARRRKLHVGPLPLTASGELDLSKFNWTIMGHRWPDGRGDYYFFSDVADYVHRTDNFFWV